MDASIIGGAVIIGIVRGLTLIPQSQFKIDGFVAFLISLSLGVLFGLFNQFGLNLETGIITALSATGVYQIAKKVGDS